MCALSEGCLSEQCRPVKPVVVQSRSPSQADIPVELEGKVEISAFSPLVFYLEKHAGLMNRSIDGIELRIDAFEFVIGL